MITYYLVKWNRPTEPLYRMRMMSQMLSIQHPLKFRMDFKHLGYIFLTEVLLGQRKLKYVWQKMSLL